MMGIYLHLFENDQDLLQEFEISEAELAPYEVLLAHYEYEDYSGDAFVLLRRKDDGTLFEVNGGHCSCYGLEGQWSPEETSKEALMHRITEGNLGVDRGYGYGKDKDVFASQLKQILSEVQS